MKQKRMNYHEKYNSFYQSKEWQLLRNQKWVASDGLCEMCKKQGIIREGKEVHHIEPISENWDKRLEYDNLLLLCSEHHNQIHDRQSPFQKFFKSWETIENKENKNNAKTTKSKY